MPGITHQENLLRSKLSSRFVLREFQYEMVEKYKDVPAVLCGDDMGLGKTYEAIALDRLKRLRSNELNAKTLVVTTLTMVDTWRREYAKTMPNMKVCCIDPKNRGLFEAAVMSGSADVYVCHWDILRMMPALASRHWFHIIGDEIHKVKNRKAQVTQAFKKIKGDHKLGLSGTPGDNRPDDLWSVLNWLYPKKFTSYWNFTRDFCNYLELKTSSGNGYRKMLGVRNENMLHREMAPFFIRRRKEEVLKDLPEKYYSQVWVDLTPKQRKAYDQMRKSQLAWVGENFERPLAAPIAISQLIRLQQFALGNVRIDDVLKTFRNNRFDPTRIEEPYDPFQHTNWRTRQEIVPEYHIEEESAKLNVAMNLIEDTDDSIVVFTQFRDVAHMLAARLHKAKITYGLVTGDVAKHHRDRVVGEFQDKQRRIFVGTFAAREGLTLTASSTEIFIDRAWSPSWNRQAEDREHRIGQTNAVHVIDIMARNTVDLGRHQQIRQKWTWLQKMFGDKVMDYQEEMQEG
jgi:SNF2 family DNA or RNA helicase